ncbi:MAG: preprotein translocase subunit SecA, partial [Verrucomicrobiales bacterium]
ELQELASPQEQLAHLQKIRPQAFAIAKNAARRLCGREFEVCGQKQVWNMVPYDVQLIGGLALAEGKLAEMHTGEGKTLAATLPTFLHALAGRGVHVITVNDYLALRDATWMGKLFEFLGLSVGCLQNGQSPEQRRVAYACDITYGTASEFGFDYLRDHGLATSRNEQVQRGRFYALIDEVDSVLIDDARTPLIIAGVVSASGRNDQLGLMPNLRAAVETLVAAQKTQCDELIRSGSIEELYQVQLAQPRHPGLLRLKENPDTLRQLERIDLRYQVASNREDLVTLKENLYFSVDEKYHDAHLSERGREFLSPDDPDAFTIPDLTEALALAKDEAGQRALEHAAAEQGERVHNIAQLLKAYCLYERDRDYLVEDGKVVIIDRQQDRKMPGRRWSDGLHQAIEAKEGVELEDETETFASVTVQNYFRLYPCLAGMSGTVATESDEFEEIYDLGVIEIPPNRPSQRQDLTDFIFKTRREKFNAIVAEVKQAYSRQQPVLLGTANVEESEVLSRMLKQARLPHAVLNAKNHAQEAEIVARAGRAGSITVSTNMAGRGTDIALGEGVAVLGGLYVIGSERHESRRVDHQLRGRCARQGDPGMSRFFVSFEDPLMQHFGDTDRIIRLLGKVDLEPGNALEHPFLSRSIQTAQKRVEASHFESRKHTLRYDNVVSQQRRTIYARRQDLIATSDPAAKLGQQSKIDPDVERAIILSLIDAAWRDHLNSLDELREGMSLVHHAQKDPLLEFRRGASLQFHEMQKQVEWQLAEEFPKRRRQYQETQQRNELAKSLVIPEINPPKPERRVSRNSLCSCGSKKKYKRCCGRL